MPEASMDTVSLTATTHGIHPGETFSGTPYQEQHRRRPPHKEEEEEEEEEEEAGGGGSAAAVVAGDCCAGGVLWSSRCCGKGAGEMLEGPTGTVAT